MPFTLEELLPNDQRLRTVQLHESVQNALSLMHQHGYDQLPVVDKDGKTSLKLVVTFDSILQASRSFKAKPELLQVRDVARPVRTYASDADLLATLDDIQRENFALIVDDENVLTGIVTTADTTFFFREYAEDLMLIEGIETRMKDAIQALYSGDGAALESTIAEVTDRAADIRRKLPMAIRAYLSKHEIGVPGDDAAGIAEAEKRLNLPKPGKNFESLSFDEFTEVLLRHPHAPKLLQSSDVAELRGLLQQVRDSRNKLAHFRGELVLEERRTIRFASEWLERNLPRAEVPIPPPSVLLPASTGETGHEDDEEQPHGSYAKLAAKLRAQSTSITSLPLSFEDIERILEKQLPRSAYEYRAWWTNDPTKPQSAAWLEEGWRAMAINMSERRLTFVRTDERERAYNRFFANLRERLKHDEPAFPLRKALPRGTNWHILASLPWVRPESAHINASFNRRRELRVELYLDCGDKEGNKRRFDELVARRDVIEATIGEPLEWRRMDDRRSCRIAASTKGQILTDFEDDALLDWAAKKAVDFHRVFGPEFAAS